MNDAQKFNLKQAGAWLSGQTGIRVSRNWLILGGVALVLLLILALD